MSLFQKMKKGLRRKFEYIKVILGERTENLLVVVLLFKILENLPKCKPFKTSRKLSFFRIISFVHST